MLKLKLYQSLGCLATALVSLAVSSSFGSAPDLSQIGLIEVVSGGSGCPSGTVRGELAPDASSFTLLFDQLTAQAGGGIPQDRKTCRVDLRVAKPRNWAFAIESADFRGFVHLEAGVVAEQRVMVESGVGEIAKVNASFGLQRWVGPIAENFLVTTVRPINGLQALSCLPLRRQTRVRVDNDLRVARAQGSLSGQITVDTVDGRLVQRYNLKWIDCAQAAGQAISDLGKLIRGLSRR